MRFREIDELTRRDHSRLLETDRCFYAWEYTSGTAEGYNYSEENSLIMNLKKHPRFRGKPQVWQYKRRAIQRSAKFLAEAINHKWLQTSTLVPVPPSKAPDHAEYDDRMLQVCTSIPVDFQLDVRELVYQTQSLHASHGEGGRHSVEDLLNVYAINEEVAVPSPSSIAVVDDVLTTGAHFRAMHTILTTRFPDVEVIGCFVARRVLPHDEWDF